MYKIKQIIGAFIGIGCISILLFGWFLKQGMQYIKKTIHHLQKGVMER